MEYIQVPPPKDHDAFEDLVLDVYSRHFCTDNPQRFGRNGQSQFGVDVVGFVPPKGLLGIQCKHYKEGLSVKDVDDVVAKADGFIPKLQELEIAVSTERDVLITQHVLSITSKRKADGFAAVHVRFWPDILNWLMDFPDLVYKYYPQFFQTSAIEAPKHPELSQTVRFSRSWPVSRSDLLAGIDETLHSVPRVTPYRVALAVSTFLGTRFAGRADILMSLGHLFGSATSPTDTFAQCAAELKEARDLLQAPEFDHDVVIYPNTRLPLAFLIGWTFRKVTGHKLLLLHRDEVWPTFGLPQVPSLLREDLPIILNHGSRELAVVLDFSRGGRNIGESVVKWAMEWDPKPWAVVGMSVDDGHIRNAAHALALAADVARRVKYMIDGWGLQHIHLFGPLPAALATLITYHLNGICPISLYYLDDDRQTYVLAGTLDNSL